MKMYRASYAPPTHLTVPKKRESNSNARESPSSALMYSSLNKKTDLSHCQSSPIINHNSIHHSVSASRMHTPQGLTAMTSDFGSNKVIYRGSNVQSKQILSQNHNLNMPVQI